MPVNASESLQKESRRAGQRGTIGVTRQVTLLAIALLLAGTSSRAEAQIPTPLIVGREPTQAVFPATGWNAMVTWSPTSMTGVAAMVVEYSPSSTFASGVKSVQVPTTDGRVTIPGLTSGVNFYFRGRGRNLTPSVVDGANSTLATIYMGMLGAPIGVTASQVADSIFGKARLTLTWRRDKYAQAYNIVYSTDSLFSTKASVLTSDTSAAFSVNFGTKNYYRVNSLMLPQPGQTGKRFTPVSSAPFVPPPEATGVNSIPTVPTNCSYIRGTAMTGGQFLYVGQKIYSPNKLYMLTYQADGNLVLLAGTAVKWSSGAAGITNPEAGGAAFLKDGKLETYSSTGAVSWSTKTALGPNLMLSVMDNGSLKIVNTACQTFWQK